MVVFNTSRNLLFRGLFSGVMLVQGGQLTLTNGKSTYLSPPYVTSLKKKKKKHQIIGYNLTYLAKGPWKINKRLTLPKTNIAPENGWLEYDCFLLGWSIFRCENVSFREGSFFLLNNASNLPKSWSAGWPGCVRSGTPNYSCCEYPLPVFSGLPFVNRILKGGWWFF